MSLQPIIQGTCSIKSPAPEFFARMKQRVAAGLLSGRLQSRSNYIITQVEPTLLRIRAADWSTALNVGLNELELHVTQPGQVRYHVRYWRWAGYAIGLSAVLGAIGLAFLLLTDVRSYIEANPSRMIPGLSTEQNLFLAWTMVLFWGGVWPWLLIHLHQRPLRRLLERVISEVDLGESTVGVGLNR